MPIHDDHPDTEPSSCKPGAYTYVTLKEGTHIVNCDTGKHIAYEVSPANTLAHHCIFEETAGKETAKTTTTDEFETPDVVTV